MNGDDARGDARARLDPRRNEEGGDALKLADANCEAMEGAAMRTGRAARRDDEAMGCSARRAIRGNILGMLVVKALAMDQNKD